MDFRVGGLEPDYTVEDELEEGVRRIGETLRDVSISMEMALTNFGRAVLVGVLLEEHLLSVQDQSHGMTLEELIPETIEEWKGVRGETND